MAPNFLDNYIFCVHRKLLTSCESCEPISLILSALIMVIVAVTKTFEGSDKVGAIAEVSRLRGCG